MSRRARWLTALAILGAIVIGVARTIEIPGVKQFIHPRTDCQDSPECRQFIDSHTISRGELRRALEHALAGLGVPPAEIARRLGNPSVGSNPPNPTNAPRNGGGSSGSPPGHSPPGGGHHGGPPSPPPPPPSTTTTTTTTPAPPPPRPHVGVCVRHPRLSICIGADLP